MTNIVKWAKGTRVKYDTLETKDINKLYFIEDTGELYKGSQSFTQSLLMVDELPELGALGKVYILKGDLSGHIFENGAWVRVIHPIIETIDEVATQDGLTSAEAVKTYVKQKFAEEVEGGNFVEGITFDKDTKDIKYVKNGEDVIVPIDGFVTGATYDGTTGKLSFAVEGGTAIDVHIPLDNFVSGGSYDADTQEIVLELTKGGEVRIPAIDLVDIYTVASSNTVEMSMIENEISAEVKISATSNNHLVANADGLFVEATDISGKADKVGAIRDGEVLTADAEGNLVASGYTAGGNVSAAGEKVLATEKAVDAIRATLQSSINTKLEKANISVVVPTDVANASDEKVLSEKAVTTAIKALDKSKINKADIVTGTINESSASTSKVVSEAALVAALAWKVL